MNKFDKFLKVTMWAQKRYYGKEEHTGLVLHRGGIPSKYYQIETMAWRKYITHTSELK